MAEVIVVNRYVLRDATVFAAAVQVLVARVQDHGHKGVRSYRFFCPTPDEGRAVVIYDDPEAWVGHHDLIMDWPELAALRAAADLEEVLLFGPVTGAMQVWIDRMDLRPRVRLLGEPVAGFIR